MNFTREPIIETIITPKDGYKLIVRSSKGGAQEEYSVDALEVVSFGHSFFFRSQERPKPFLVPVSDYEVVEAKEVRVALKNAAPERNIKIGGGREAPVRPQREHPPERHVEPSSSEEGSQEGSEDGSTDPNRSDKKRERGRRHRRRRGGPDDRPRPQPQEGDASGQEGSEDEEGGVSNEVQSSSAMFSALIPPPSTLISETIGRYKEFAIPEKAAKEAEKKEKSEEEPPKASEDSSGADVQPLNRMATSVPSYDGLSVTYLRNSTDTYFIS